MRKVFTNEREVLFDLAVIKQRLKNGSAAKAIIKSVLKICLSADVLSGEQHKWMFVNTVPRKDHMEFFRMVQAQCPYDKGDFVWSRKYCINFRNFINLFRYLPNFGELKKLEIPAVSDNPEGLKYVPETLTEQMLLYLNLIRNMEMKRAIAKYDWSGVKTVVALFDIGEPEHFVVNHANVLGLKTVVLCHGIMFNRFDYKDMNSFNMYKVPSKYFLALGRDIIPLAKQFGSDAEVLVCGQIKIKEQVYEPDEKLIAVAGNIPADHEDNVEMIQIAQEYAKKHGMHVCIRLHPTDKSENYQVNKEICSFEKNIDNAKVIISYRSSMLFTYMALGKNVMRYDGRQSFYDVPQEILFKTYNEFEEKIGKLGCIDFKEIAREHIDCIGQEAAEKYRKAFEYIEGK